MNKKCNRIKRFTSFLAFAYLLLPVHSPQVKAQDSSNNVETAPELLKTPPNQKKPTEVSIGIYITNFANIDQANESSEIVGYLFATWKDPRLAFKPKKDEENTKYYNIEDIWQPGLEIINSKEFREQTNNDVRVETNGTVHYQETFKINLSSGLDLKRFPFDSQKVNILLESFKYDINKVKLVSQNSLSGLSKDSYVSLAEWHIQGVTTRVEQKKFDPENTYYSRLIFEINIKRNYGFYIWKVGIPLLLLTIISWMVFWIEPKEFGTQVSISITSMLSVIAFSFTVNDALPRVAYLTFIDGFIFLCYVFVFLSLFIVILVHYLSTTGKEKKGLMVQNNSRWFFPITFSISNLLLIILIMLT
ncbi:hypothetical protein H6F50_12815 [Coleofasciculus sp. FACHB-712]|uniref:hypothetical protein n=1 Tax=Coleofasciculus sp. FACHB-712 TaxID=2692789 RepID=UPI001682641C|nr:hypothetical protein [Coleofasciculus sp. FACHB-712]MBD1943226.1 hypothetical protein [Coleofasciculus sp. FACHB-712]